MQWKCIFAINCWKGKVHNNKHTTFFRFSNIHTTKNSHIWFLTIFLRLTGISKNSRQLEEVFFSSLMHQLCRKHQKLTTTNFLLNRSSLTTFFLVIHSEPHFLARKLHYPKTRMFLAAKNSNSLFGWLFVKIEYWNKVLIISTLCTFSTTMPRH